jgi:methionine-S-sulfoxide reductase
MKTIYLAGGCFWGAEKYLTLIPGVKSTCVGYANGNTASPSYEQVCKENTGHAETVKVVYDENQIRLKTLLRLFFEVIDPISLNRQSHDTGTQYRTGIYYAVATDKPIIEEALLKLQAQYKDTVVVENLPLENFYDAEEYHQRYLDKNPSGYCHIGKAHFDRAALLEPFLDQE